MPTPAAQDNRCIDLMAANSGRGPATYKLQNATNLPPSEFLKNKVLGFWLKPSQPEQSRAETRRVKKVFAI